MWALWACLALLSRPSLGDDHSGGVARRLEEEEERPPASDRGLVLLPAHKRQSVQYSTLVGPSFVNASLNAHAHAPLGQTAYLTCVVRNLHNYTVSWVRARDIHLLTTGETTYTSDHRFVAVNPAGGARWVLRLHHARPSDAGAYLCQVSVTPPISTSVTLLVTEAVARVYPGREVFLKESSRLLLVCEVRGCPYPAHPTWLRGRQAVEGTEVEEGFVTAPPPTSSTAAAPSSTPDADAEDDDDDARPSSPSTSTSTSSSSSTSPTTSTSSSSPPSTSSSTSLAIGLPVARATMARLRAEAAHSGVYTCTNACTTPLNLTLHVLEGDEETAAMQHLSGAPRLRGGGGGGGGGGGAATRLLVLAAVTSWAWREMTS